MKKLIYLLLFVLPSILAGQTILYNASTPHTDGTPSGAPTTYGAWIRYDKTNKVLYRWTGAAWTAITGAGVGGIYGGSGTVPAGTTASMDAGIAFANASASAGERFSVTLDDGSSTNYFELEAGQGILLQSSGDGIFFEGETGFTDVISSGALGASQNDYAGLDGANVGLLSASTAIDITGIAGGFGGRILFLFNTSANTITLKNNSGSSAEANQFDIGGDYELTGDKGVILIYDGTATNWRLASCPDDLAIPDQQIPFGNTSGSGLSSEAGLIFDGDGIQIDEANTYVGLYGSTSAQFFAVDESASAATKGGTLLLASQDGAAMASGDRLGIINFGGQTGVGGTGIGATIEAYTAGTWAVGNTRSNLMFSTAATGSATPTERVRITNAGEMHLRAQTKLRLYNTANTINGTIEVAQDSVLYVTSPGAGSTGEIYLNGEIGLFHNSVTVSGTANNVYANAGGLLDISSTASGAAATITGMHPGIVASGGRLLLLHNSGNYNITLEDESASSTAENRFSLGGADFVLSPGQYILLVYNNGTGVDRWFVPVGKNDGNGFNDGVATLRPAQLTATTNNWNPTGYSTTRTHQNIEFSGDGSFRTITGLLAGTRDGVEKTLINTGTNCLVLAKQHTSSDAANRFNISKDVIMLPGMEATFRYDSVGAAWRLKATSKDDVTFNALTETSLKNGFSTIGGEYPDFVWTANGGAFSGSGATGTTFRNRFFQFSTSTAAMAWPTLSTKVREIYIDSDFSYHRMTGRVRIEDLATGANAFEVRFGYKTTLDTNIVEGAYINYNYTENSGGWTLKTHDGSTLTTTNAGAAVAADTWYNLELIYYPYGEVTAFINGTRYTATSTLPEAIAANPFLQLDKDEGSTGTTARLMYVTAFDTFGCNVSE